jgi:hypothetical protein
MDQKDIQIFNMTLDNILNNIIEEQVTPGNEKALALKTSKSKPLVDAIVNRHPITFYYSGPRKPKKDSVKAGYRIKAEAVALGLNKKGNLVIRAFIDDPSKSKRGTPGQVGMDKSNFGWRTFLVTRMSGVQVLTTETFDTPRAKYKAGNDDSMSVTYVVTDFNKKPEEPKKKIVTKPAKISKPAPTKPEPVSVKPSKTPQKPQVTKQTRDFDQEITNVQNDLATVVADMKTNNEKYQSLKNDPVQAKQYLDILKDLTAKKKDLEKKSDELVDQMSQATISVDNVKAQKFMSANAARQKEPETTLPEIPKNEKPGKTPEDEPENLNEGFLKRIKQLMTRI